MLTRSLKRSGCCSLLLAMLAACSPRETTVFTARTSPDGFHIAESVLLDDGEFGSRLAIRSKSVSEQHVDFQESMPGIFLRWVDDTHLEVWHEPSATEMRLPAELGGISIVSRTYVRPPRQENWYRDASNVSFVSVRADGVSASFVKRPDRNGKSCILTLATKPTSSFDHAQVEIVAGVYPQSGRSRSAAGINTHFELADSASPHGQTMLTSATISDIPSYNELPEGRTGTAVRGQFLEQSAASLIDVMKGPSISLDFSRDFFSRILRYELSLSGVAPIVRKFEECVGDADMLWLRHEP